MMVWFWYSAQICVVFHRRGEKGELAVDERRAGGSMCRVMGPTGSSPLFSYSLCVAKRSSALLMALQFDIFDS